MRKLAVTLLLALPALARGSPQGNNPIEDGQWQTWFEGFYSRVTD